MKLSISNIGWDAKQDEAVYRLMGAYGFSGLEIAPTRIFPEAPYSQWEAAKRWSENLKAQYGFGVSSMQSIWYGRQEKLFGNEEERQVLLAYTKEAIDFAAAVGCGNLVFGCPRNRNVPEGIRPEQVEEIACSFFHELGEYAYSKGTALSIEANPPIYHTNYINDTRAALDLVEKVGSRGFLLNLDVGTVVACGETRCVGGKSASGPPCAYQRAGIEPFAKAAAAQAAAGVPWAAGVQPVCFRGDGETKPVGKD